MVQLIQQKNAINTSSKIVESPRAFRSSWTPIFVKSQTAKRSKLETLHRQTANAQECLDIKATLPVTYETISKSVPIVL